MGDLLKLNKKGLCAKFLSSFKTPSNLYIV